MNNRTIDINNNTYNSENSENLAMFFNINDEIA